MIKFRNLKADEIDVKVGSVGKKGYTCLLYKNARVDMAILDETVGAENWQRDHKEVKGNLYCGIGINVNYADETKSDKWVWKWDCGVESAFGDKEKGEASDSFKRAGFNWGIGRELYTSPLIFMACETKYNDSEKKKCYQIANDEDLRTSQSLKVGLINYNDKSEISGLTITDRYGNTIFTYGLKKEDKASGKVTKEQINLLLKVYTGDNFVKLLEFNNVSKIEDLSYSKAEELINKIYR